MAGSGRVRVRRARAAAHGRDPVRAFENGNDESAGGTVDMSEAKLKAAQGKAENSAGRKIYERGH